MRYHLATKKQQQERQRDRDRERQQVTEVALNHKTYGYRGVYIELNKVYKVGREKVRYQMAQLGLGKQRPKRTRKPAPAFSKVCSLPKGRKVQIDATGFELKGSSAWKYVVEDVASRACLALHTVKSLSQEAAASALLAAQSTLEKLGIKDNLVIQSDAGSDFTSHHFQDTCTALEASWHRSRINEKAGMGILERLNRTLKWDFVFWHDPQTLEELQNLDDDFELWYNHQRIHSAIGYLTPWQKLSLDAMLSLPVG